MVSVATITDIDLLDRLVQRYVDHQIDEGVTLDTVKKQMQNGLVQETHHVLIEVDSKGEAQGFLVINLNSDRIPIIFANWNFQSEKRLLDYAFKKLSPTCSHISFESGWPTPWLSEDLSTYAQKLGFEKHNRVYMQLHPIDNDTFSNVSIEDDFEFIPFEKSMVEEISKLVFKCVDGTIDQDLFPYVYGSILKIAKFLNNFLEGTFGKHEPFYSWILRENKQNIGACFCFQMANDETGGLMHIVIDPEYRQRGFGRAILCHSFRSLLRITPSISKIELAVTMSNPAKLLYDSLGFRTLNDSSTFVWKR